MIQIFGRGLRGAGRGYLQATGRWLDTLTIHSMRLGTACAVPLGGLYGEMFRSAPDDGEDYEPSPRVYHVSVGAVRGYLAWNNDSPWDCDRSELRWYGPKPQATEVD